MHAHETAPRSLGLDFGTTNTVLAWAHLHAPADPVVFKFLSNLLFAFRSALCFWDEGDENHPQVMSEAGPWAIQRFIEASGECRFIQSLKSFAASRLFETTGIYGRAYKFEHLFAAFFESLRKHAAPQLDHLPGDVLVGRPVQYVGSRPDAALAMQRYELALAPFGFERIRQVYEPVAAAFFYAQALEDSATVLVADFGGGTTDFSVISFDVGKHGLRAQALGHSGVGVAGDRFDYRIIDRVVLPQLGKGTTYRSVGKTLEMPRSCFASFANWHELSVMKGSAGFKDLKELAAFSTEPELVQRFIRLVESDQGYRLYKAVSDAKEALSPTRRRASPSRARASASRARSRAPTSNRGSPKSWRRSRRRSIPCSRMRRSPWATSTASSSPAAARSCRQCAGSSKGASAPRASSPATSSSRSPMASRRSGCARTWTRGS